MSSHQQIQEWLAVYDELATFERQQVDDHLHTCPQCAATLAAYRTMDQHLQQLRVDQLYAVQQNYPILQPQRRQTTGQATLAQPAKATHQPFRLLPTRTALLQVAGVGLLVLLLFAVGSGLIGHTPFDQLVTAATPTSLLTITTLSPTVTVTVATQPHPAQVTTVRFATYDWREPLYQPLVAEFEAANPDVKIELVSFQELLGVTDYVWPDDAFPQLLTQADVIDLFVGPREARPELVRDLTPLLNADPTFAPADFYPNVLNAYQWDGGTWGLPTEISFSLIYYRKDRFDAAKLPYPQPGWRWEDFAQTAQALTQRTENEVTVWGFVNKWGDHVGLLESQTGPLFVGTNAAIINRLQTPTVVDALQRYTNLVQVAQASPFFAPPAPGAATGFTPESTLVELGQAAMWTDMASNWQWNRDQGEIGVVPFPEGPTQQPSTQVSSQGRTISTRSSDPTAAWHWLRFLSQQDHRGIVSALQLPHPAQAAAAGAWQGMDEATIAAMQYALAHSYTRAYGYDYTIEQAFAEAVATTLQGDTPATTALAGLPQAVTAIRQAARVKSSTPITTTVGSAPTATTTITYMIGYAGSELGALRTLAKTFAAQQPSIQVNVQYPPDQAGLFTLADITAQADCFDWSPIVYNADQLHLLMSLEPFLAADTTDLRSDFFPGLLAQFTVQDQLWALPDEARPKVVEYNKARFDAAGIAYPVTEWTVDDLAALATQLTRGSDLTKQYGFAGDYYELADAELLIKRRGGHFYELASEPPTFTFTATATIAAVEWYTGLSRAGVKPQFSTTVGEIQADGLTLQQRAALINAGRVAMWTKVFGVSDQWYQLPGGLQTGIVPLPRTLEGKPMMDPMFSAGYYISAATPHADACWQWLQFLTEQPSAVDGVPARRSVAESTAYREKVGAEVADVLVPLLANYTPPGDDQLLFTEPWLAAVQPWWERAYQQMITGERTAATALRALQERAMNYRQCIIDAAAFTDAAQQQTCAERTK